MKTCVSTYSFSQWMSKNNKTLFDAIDKTRELGFDAIEFCIGDDLEGGRDTIVKLRDRCAEIGLPIASYTTGANFLVADPKAEVERMKENVDRAALLGAPCLRHDICWSFYEGYNGVKTFEAALGIMAPYIRELTEYAAQKGVKTMSENHGYFAQDADRINALINAVNHPNYGWLCDMGNFCCADEDSVTSVSKLAPLAMHVHAKDMFLRSGSGPNPGRGWGKTRGGNYFRGTIFGHGNTPTFQCLSILHNAGYNGYVSLEFEGIEDNIPALEIGLENMRNYLAIIEG